LVVAGQKKERPSNVDIFCDVFVRKVVIYVHLYPLYNFFWMFRANKVGVALGREMADFKLGDILKKHTNMSVQYVLKQYLFFCVFLFFIYLCVAVVAIAFHRMEPFKTF